MPSDNKWKSGLLSSSLPFEFEAAKVLISQSFAVNADFVYNRSDAGTDKDFSVDIQAIRYAPFNRSQGLSLNTTLLTECKYRSPNMKWFFLTDPNGSDGSPIVGGNTIRVVDQFSRYRVDLKDMFEFEAGIHHCYKGVEINIEKGDVYDKEIRHGIAQLQFALPRLFIKEVLSHTPDKPFAFCPILLTNADLFVSDISLSIESVRNASQLSEIGTTTPYLLLSQGYGPDFEKHCIREFSHLKDLSAFKSSEKITNNQSVISSRILQAGREFANGDIFHLERYFTSFIICNFTYFDTLLINIKNIVDQLSAKATEIS
jgi:hypothetical protein